MLDGDVAQADPLLCIGKLCLEVADVDACDGVLGLKLVQVARDSLLADGIKYHMEVGYHVEMLGVKEATLGAPCVLAGQMVVVLVVCLFHRRTITAAVRLDRQMADACLIVYHDITFLPQRLPLVG